MTANSAPGRERRHVYDLVVIGGGVNGVLIARDAAGRGLSVLLCEQDDLASATSSASSKLIHGGLRYLEQGQFRLVRESLKEREVLRHNGHHLIQPMRFVLPVGPNSRPEWMLKLGLWLYDRIGGRQSVPRAERIDLTADARGRILKPAYTAGFAYSDCWVDDSRYVVLNAVDAARRGAVIRTRTCCTAARREGPRWRVTAERANGEEEEFRCRALVNAAGPWVASVLTEVVGSNTAAAMRLVRGSHIVVPKLYDGNHAYILQAADRRVVFVLPFEQSYSLIGTTEVALDAPLAARGQPHIDPSETQYLCDTVAAYFESAVGPADVVWTFSGIRPLYDDGSGNPSRITRDYVLEVDAPKGEAPIVSVFGGKITTARRLAEAVLARLGGHLLNMRENWTE